MTQHTISLRDLVELHKPENVQTDTFLGMSTYPIFDVTYRTGLNKKIRDHYWFNEIAHETIDIFVFQMRTKLNEIMPMYNQLYESSRMQFDPFKTIDMSTVTSGEQESESSSTATGSAEGENTSKSRTVNSMTPQVPLGGNADYATAAADSNSTGNNTGTTSANESATASNETNTESKTSGYQGNPSVMLAQFRATILNIDMMVIDELEELFFGLTNNNDEYFDHSNYFYGTPLFGMRII